MTAPDWQDALRALLPDEYTPEPDPQPESRTSPLPRLTITLDKKRAGKTATIVSGFDPDDLRAAEIAALLKKKLACGGSSRGGEILIQGDRVADVRKILTSQGYKVK